MLTKKYKWLLPILATIIIVLALGSTVVEFVTELQWFISMGYLATFLTALKYKTILFVPIALIFAVIMKIYLDVIFAKYIKMGHIEMNDKTKKVNHKKHTWAAMGVGVLLGYIFSAALWFNLLQLIYGKPFGLNDPIYNMDVSYYLFAVPFLQEVLRLGIMTIIIWVLVTMAFYAIVLQQYPPTEGTVFYINPANGPLAVMSMIKRDIFASAIKRFAVLGAVFYVLLGLTFLTMAYGILYSKQGVAFGAGFTDVNVTLRGLQALAIVSFVSAPIFFIGIFKNKKKWLLSGPIVLFAVGILMGVSSFIVQKWIVEPDELTKESPYLTYNIQYTQRAFGLKDVEINQFPVDQNITSEEISNSESTIKNIRINDEKPLIQIYNQIQALRLYYEFNHVTMDRYTVDGIYRQMFISPRELNVEKLDPKAQTWINTHLKYTHGYGFVAAPVNEVESDGLPKLMVKNIPPIANEAFKVVRPEIYFGEKTNAYAIVGAKESEFDYPSGSENQETRYTGKDGISLEGFNRFLYAVKESSVKLFLSTNITKDSKILIHRNLYDRVTRIAPFLVYDQTPQFVVNQKNGKLYWIIDAYTASTNFPYSQRFNFKGYQVNYLRNSIKVVVDAYDGTVDFYQVDGEDPVANTYGNIYRGLLKPVSQCDPALIAHFKYPKDLFKVQAEVFKTFHVNNPKVFYNGEDQWSLAKEKYLSEVQAYEPNYVMFTLPGEKEAELALMQPFTPREKANLSALLVARNDGEHYGKLYAYQLPKDKTIDGPMMIESKIDQDSVISPQFTLWSQEGSSVLRGNVIITPVGNSLLYTEAIYLKAENENSMPEVKRVIAVYKDKIVMEESLALCLEKLFGKNQAVKNEATQGVKGAETGNVGNNQPGVVLTLEEAKALSEELQKAIDKVNELIQKIEGQNKK